MWISRWTGLRIRTATKSSHSTSTWSGWPGSRNATRTSCRAGCSSGSRSPAPWWQSRTCSTWTSPFGALDALTRLGVRNELLRILTRDRPTCLLVTHDVEEALHVADRVFVMTPRPAKVALVVDVTAPRPRRMSSPELVGLKERILTELGLSSVDVA